MSGNAQKTPLVRAFNQGAQQRALGAIDLLGKALPCSVVSRQEQIVTVKFELDAAPFALPNVTMPIAAPFYDWIPLQEGDNGVTMPAAVYLGGISGLGGGVADLTPQPNLSALVFVPVSKTSWTVPDTNQRVVQGPTGVLLRDTGDGSSVNLTPTEITITAATSITLQVGSVQLVINSTGIFLQGKEWLPHEHTGVTSGGSNTGGVA